MSITIFEKNLEIYSKPHEDLKFSSIAGQNNSSRQTIYNIFNEKNRIKLFTIIKILKTLNISFIQMNTPKIFEPQNKELQLFDKSIN